MFQLIRKKLELVTPELAGKFLDANIYEGQRPLRPQHVEVLKNAIESSVFLTGSIAIAKQRWDGGAAMLANGQHQCEAVIATGKPIVAVVEEYECNTPQDFAILYRQFDNNAARSLSEIALPEARSRNLAWSRRFIGIMLAGISFLEGHSGMHKNKRVESLKKYIRDGNFIHGIYAPATFPEYRHMGRGPVVAAMIVTFRKDPVVAEDFWEEVRDGDGLRKSSPSFKLRDYLRAASVGVGRGVRSPSFSTAASYREMYSKCIVAWNAYRRGDSTQLKFFSGNELPKPI